jgi:hypothetical protein
MKLLIRCLVRECPDFIGQGDCKATVASCSIARSIPAITKPLNQALFNKRIFPNLVNELKSDCTSVLCAQQ